MFNVQISMVFVVHHQKQILCHTQYVGSRKSELRAVGPVMHSLPNHVQGAQLCAQLCMCMTAHFWEHKL